MEQRLFPRNAKKNRQGIKTQNNTQSYKSAQQKKKQSGNEKMNCQNISLLIVLPHGTIRMVEWH